MQSRCADDQPSPSTGSSISHRMRDASGAVQAHVDRLPGMANGLQRVVGRGGPALLLGVEVDDGEQPVEGETPQAGQPLVHGN